MANFNQFNVRGLWIEPQNRPDVNYFLGVIDLPGEGISASDFSINKNPDNPQPNTIYYTYTGDFNALNGNSQTFNLPLYTFNPLKIGFGETTAIVLADVNGNIIPGNPNKGRPPIVTIDATPKNPNGYFPNNVVFASETLLDGENYQYYFVVVMTSTDGVSTEGGYKNTFGSYQPVGDGNTMGCELVSDSSIPSRAVAGVFPVTCVDPTNNYPIQFVIISNSEGNGTGPSYSIQWFPGASTNVIPV
jgi:hypothetical protein